jgi:hypothetical protein
MFINFLIIISLSAYFVVTVEQQDGSINNCSSNANVTSSLLMLEQRLMDAVIFHSEYLPLVGNVTCVTFSSMLKSFDFTNGHFNLLFLLESCLRKT